MSTDEPAVNEPSEMTKPPTLVTGRAYLNQDRYAAVTVPSDMAMHIASLAASGNAQEEIAEQLCSEAETSNCSLTFKAANMMAAAFRNGIPAQQQPFFLEGRSDAEQPARDVAVASITEPDGRQLRVEAPLTWVRRIHALKQGLNQKMTQARMATDIARTMQSEFDLTEESSLRLVNDFFDWKPAARLPPIEDAGPSKLARRSMGSASMSQAMGRLQVDANPVETSVEAAEVGPDSHFDERQLNRIRQLVAMRATANELASEIARIRPDLIEQAELLGRHYFDQGPPKMIQASPETFGWKRHDIKELISKKDRRDALLTLARAEGQDGQEGALMKALEKDMMFEETDVLQWAHSHFTFLAAGEKPPFNWHDYDPAALLPKEIGDQLIRFAKQEKLDEMVAEIESSMRDHDEVERHWVAECVKRLAKGERPPVVETDSESDDDSGSSVSSASR